jgi:sugar transferase EpsL
MRLPSRAAKRGLDLVGACVGLVIASPLIAASGIAIWRSMGRPVFFIQERPGRDERPIRVCKLRTMIDPIRSDGTVVPEYDRVTPLGRLLRKTSVDELPQLWNVLKGDMSLVGPRPLLTDYLQYYNAEQKRRHAVRPGITGQAQIHRHSISSWHEQLAMDVWYVDNQSLRLDLSILLRTFADAVRALRRGGADASMDTLSRTPDEERRFRG